MKIYENKNNQIFTIDLLIVKISYIYHLYTDESFRFNVWPYLLGVAFQIGIGPYEKSKRLIIAVGISRYDVSSWLLRRTISKMSAEEAKNFSEALKTLEDEVL